MEDHKETQVFLHLYQLVFKSVGILPWKGYGGSGGSPGLKYFSRAVAVAFLLLHAVCDMQGFKIYWDYWQFIGNF